MIGFVCRPPFKGGFFVGVWFLGGVCMVRVCSDGAHKSERVF